MLLCYCYALFSFVSLGYWNSSDNISAAFTSSQPTELKRPSRNMQWLWKNWMFLEMFVYKDFIGIFSHAQKQNNTPLTLLHHSPRWIKSFQNFLIFSDFKLILHGGGVADICVPYLQIQGNPTYYTLIIRCTGIL